MMKIPFSPPDIGEEEIQAVIEALQSGWITTGPRTKKFEARLSEFCQTEKTACFDSCSAALEMALRLLGVGPGDEVIVPAYTYTATASVVCHVGAVPVMIDCGAHSVQMDYDRLPDLINERTKVIIPVDLGGVPCQYDRIYEAVQAKRTLFCPSSPLQEIFDRVIVLADAAHSLGARRNTRMTGELADFTAFSFHAVKNLTTGEGGALTWRRNDALDNAAIYQQLMLFSLHGQSKDALAKTKMGGWEYDVAGPYYKCNMTDIAAAIGLVQLKRLPAMLRRRRKLIEYYDRELQGCELAMMMHFSEKEKLISSGHLYMVKLLHRGEEERGRLIEQLAANGVAANVHYKPLPMLTAYKNMGFRIADFPNAYQMYKNEVTLPLYSRLTDEEAEYVVKTVRKLLGK